MKTMIPISSVKSASCLIEVTVIGDTLPNMVTVRRADGCGVHDETTIYRPPAKPDPEWKRWLDGLEDHGATDPCGVLLDIMHEVIEYGGDMGPNGNTYQGVDEGQVMTDNLVDHWLERLECAFELERKAHDDSFVVLSIDPSDIDEQLDPAKAAAIHEAGLEVAVLERARRYMWDSMDNSDTFSRDLSEAADAVLEHNHIWIDDDAADDMADFDPYDDIPF